MKLKFNTSEEFFEDNEMEDTATEETENPNKFLSIEHEHPSTAFKVMEAFAETVKDYKVKSLLVNALQKRKPFANFKYVIDNSVMREQWFEFRNEAYAEIAKEWLEVNAPGTLKERIKLLL